jgi:hypothetical protein
MFQFPIMALIRLPRKPRARSRFWLVQHGGAPEQDGGAPQKNVARPVSKGAGFNRRLHDGPHLEARPREETKVRYLMFVKMAPDAGGHAHLLGVSSGAALVLEAAKRGVMADKMIGYEAPFILDGTHAPNDPALPGRMRALVEAGKRPHAAA